MKLSAFFLLLCLQVAATGSGQKITLNAQNEKLGRVLKLIERQSAYRFVYSNQIVPVNTPVTLKVAEKDLTDVLSQLLTGFNLDFREEGGKMIVIFQESEQKAAAAQIADLRVEGRVYNEIGSPLQGATILVKGTNNGTSTNKDGAFVINVPDAQAVLVVSYIGYLSQEVRLQEGVAPSVRLQVDESKKGEEIVIVGYGTQRRKDVTGAIGKINAEQISSVPVASPDQAIQGRVSGVQVVQTSGAPGGAVQVRVRGVNSTAGNGANQPLYVVDGVPLVFNEGVNSLSVGNEGSSGGAGSNGASPLNTISANDIESIEVLKDASATAIYGSRAANGVVLITTKTGRIGKPQISFNTYYGVQSLRRKIPVLNARERGMVFFEHRRNGGTRANEGGDPWFVNPFLLPQGTDWQDEMFRTAPMANYNLSVSGGSDRITYSVSGDYQKQDGIVINTFSNRASARLNFDVRATDKLKIGARNNLSYQWENQIATDEFFQSQLNGLLVNSPLLPVKDSTGNYAGRPNTQILNNNWFGPSGDNLVANQMERERRADRYRAISSVYGEYSFLPSLRLRSSFAIDYLFTELRQYTPVWFRGVDQNSPASLFESNPKTYNWLTEHTLSYDKSFGAHTLNAVAGFSAQKFRIKTLGGIANGSVSNVLNQLSNNPTPTSVFGGITDAGLVSQFVRANYAFKGRYLFTGTVRRDGSSRFGKNNQYGYFPSASIGWRVMQESFMQNVNFLSDLKLRASYGSTGNQEIGNFLFQPLMSNTSAVFGNGLAPGVAPTRFENRDIQWERNNQMDIGVDIGLLNGRLNISADYYRKRTEGLLGVAPLSVISGVGNSITQNIGVIENRGFEFALNAQILNNKDWRWTVDFNISTNQNEVISLGSQPFINGASIWRTPSFINRTEPGHPIGGFWVLQKEGQIQTWEEARVTPLPMGSVPYVAPGDFKYKDQNKDGKIDDADRVWVGSPFPDFFGGVSTNIGYKGLSLGAFGAFQRGNLIWNQPRLNAESFEGNTWREVWDNRWTTQSAGTETRYAVPRAGHPILPSDHFLEDGSFFRIRNITLSYELAARQLSFLKIKGLKFYAQGNNLFVFTKYTGWDPEVNSFGSNVTTNGIDIGGYPQAKSFVFGLNMNF